MPRLSFMAVGEDVSALDATATFPILVANVHTKNELQKFLDFIYEKKQIFTEILTPPQRRFSEE